jgi:hypothetical protein
MAEPTAQTACIEEECCPSMTMENSDLERAIENVKGDIIGFLELLGIPHAVPKYAASAMDGLPARIYQIGGRTLVVETKADRIVLRAYFARPSLSTTTQHEEPDSITKKPK